MVSWHTCQSGRSGNAARRCAAICSGLHSSSSFGLDLSPQLLVNEQPRSAWPARTLPGASVGQVSVVDAVVMGQRVAAQLTAHGRRGTGPAARRSHAHQGPARAAWRSADAPEETGTGSTAPPPRSPPAEDHRSPPAIDTRSCGRYPEPRRPRAFRHRLKQLPVGRLDLEPALTSSSRHQHALHDQVCCDKH